MALVYHDIGLWSDSNLAYLEPSCAAAVEAASKLGLPQDQVINNTLLVGLMFGWMLAYMYLLTNVAMSISPL